MIKDGDLHILRRRLPLRAAQILVNLFSRFFSVGNGTDNETGAERKISGGEDTRGCRHQRFGVYFWSSLTRDFDSVRRSEAGNIRGLTNRKDDRVALNQALAALFKLRIESFVRIEDGFAANYFESDQFAVLADKLFGPKRGLNVDSLFQPFMDFFFGRRHLFARFKADKLHAPCAHAQRSAGDVHKLFHRDVHLAFRQMFGKDACFFSFCAALVLLAHRRSCDINRDIASTDHDNLFADGKAIAKIDVQEEIDALHDSIQLVTRQIQIAASVQTERKQDGFVALALQVFEREIATEAGIQTQFRPEVENLAHLCL